MRIAAAVLSPRLGKLIGESIVDDERAPALALDVDVASSLAKDLGVLAGRDKRAVICCAQAVRLPLARFAEACGMKVTVIGLAEVAPGYVVVPTVTLDVPDTA